MDHLGFAQNELTAADLLRRAGNPLEEVYYRHSDRVAWKWHHYLEVFDRHFGRYRGQSVRILELGVLHGGSLQIWKTYFGAGAIVHGLDINVEALAAAEDRIVVHIGDQSDRSLLAAIVAEMGGVDIVIDDAGHRGPNQIASFEALYPLLHKDGVYVCEDLHAAYWRRFGGGWRRLGTFIEYAKARVDDLHVWYLEPDAPVTDEAFARMTKGIFFYDSMVVFEKAEKTRPFHTEVGQRRIL